MARSRRVALRYQRDSLERLEDRVVMSAELPIQPHLPHQAEVQVVQAEPRRTIVSPTPATPTSGHTFLYKLNGGKHDGACVSPPPGALSPAQSPRINEVDQVSDLGKGQTIAIVDAYDDANVTTDADMVASRSMTTLGGTTSYLMKYGAASTWLTKTWPSGVTTPGKTG